jgi:predicted amidohydrolase YtcJ
MENEIGSLEVGKQADFVVLDHDPLDAKNDLRQIQVVKTIHASQLSVLLE